MYNPPLGPCSTVILAPIFMPRSLHTPLTSMGLFTICWHSSTYHILWCALYSIDILYNVNTLKWLRLPIIKYLKNLFNVVMANYAYPFLKVYYVNFLNSSLIFKSILWFFEFFSISLLYNSWICSFENAPG